MNPARLDLSRLGTLFVARRSSRHRERRVDSRGIAVWKNKRRLEIADCFMLHC
jgi:hypothetical protein